MAKGDDIQRRLTSFAVRIIRLSANLTKSSAEKHIARQILRSGTSPAPNYAEARSAESINDFIHKLKVVLKELNETGVWMDIMIESKMTSVAQSADLQNECDELCRIISSSIKTATNRKLNN
jgi:four helix bundle protein